MLIEQIIEFELRGPGPPDHIRAVTPKLVVFMTKQKSVRQIFERNIIYC